MITRYEYECTKIGALDNIVYNKIVAIIASRWQYEMAKQFVQAIAFRVTMKDLCCANGLSGVPELLTMVIG